MVTTLSQVLVLKCKLCDGVVTVVFVVLLYSLYLLSGRWRQNAKESAELQYRTDYPMCQLPVMPDMKERKAAGRRGGSEYGMNSG